MLKILYCIYQVIIAIPVTILMTIWTAFLVGVGCAIGNGHYWGYYPGRWWARVITRVFLLPVKVEGRGVVVGIEFLLGRLVKDFNCIGDCSAAHGEHHDKHDKNRD